MFGSRGGPLCGPRCGVIAGAEGSSGAAPAWTTDAGAALAIPASVVEWNAFNAAKSLTNWSAPNEAWYFDQLVSGNAVGAYTGLTFPAVGTPTYGQSATPYTRTGVGFDDNTTDRFTGGAGVGPDPLTTPSLWLYLTVLRTEPIAARIIGGATRCASSTTNARLSYSPSAGTNRLQLTVAAVGTAGTVDHPAGPHEIFIKYDPTANESIACSELDKLYGTHSDAVIDSDKGIGGNVTADMVCTAMFLWTGAAAQRSMQDLKDMLVAMGRTIAWSP